MANKVKWGLSNVYFAKRTVSAQNVVSYETPVAHDGAISLTLTRSADKNVFFADNKAFFTSFNKGAKEGTLEVALIKDFVKTNYLGYKADVNGKLVETDAIGDSFALLFQIEGDESAKKYCIYNCTAAEADSEYATKEENTEPKSSSMTLAITGETVGNLQCFATEVDNFTSVALPSFSTL